MIPKDGFPRKTGEIVKRINIFNAVDDALIEIRTAVRKVLEERSNLHMEPE